MFLDCDLGANNDDDEDGGPMDMPWEPELLTVEGFDYVDYALDFAEE